MELFCQIETNEKIERMKVRIWLNESVIRVISVQSISDAYFITDELERKKNILLLLLMIKGRKGNICPHFSAAAILCD